MTTVQKARPKELAAALQARYPIFAENMVIEIQGALFRVRSFGKTRAIIETLHGAEIRRGNLTPDAHQLVERAAAGKREPWSVKVRRWMGRVAVLAVAMSAPANAWTVRVVQSAVSPDGRFRVELADYRQETAFELYVTRVGSAAAPQKISGPLPKDHDVSGFQISPDSQHVVYRQGQTAQVVGGNWRLYVVPIAGGQVVNLTPTLVPGGNVEPSFTILPGDRARWVADAIVDETYLDFEASIAVRIFVDGFESRGTGAWR